MQSRLRALAWLKGFSCNKTDSPSPDIDKVLVDGMWDNPNYWTRYAIVRRALGLAGGREVGLVGRHSREKVRTTFSAMGITSVVGYHAVVRSERHAHLAQTLLSNVKTPDELLRLRMPMDFPATLIFDGILKRQRRATIDVDDPELSTYLAEAFVCLEEADRILGSGGYNLVVLSHALDYTYSAIAWAAIRRGIPVLVLYGDYGAARFFRLEKEADLFAYPARPMLQEIEGMPPPRQAHLREQGAFQLHARFDGQTDDVGSIYAYRRRRGSVDKTTFADRFGWNPAKPVIGVYNSNWFDYPHASGLHDFRDFLDWIESTLAVARQCDSVNWLFKAHPCDDWYASIQGTRLEELVAKMNLPHIRLADKSWNGVDLIRSLDGIVTCHGTIGIEASSLGTPVLVPYPGWYGHAGFVVSSRNRASYLETLATEWWKGADVSAGRAKAELFAGWMFCVPDWHGSYIFQDDSRQDSIYRDLPEFLDANRTALDKEVCEIRDWFDSGHSYLHVFKMSRADGFQLVKCKPSGLA